MIEVHSKRNSSIKRKRFPQSLGEHLECSYVSPLDEKAALNET